MMKGERLSLQGLIDAAIQDTDKSWEAVGEDLPVLCTQEEIYAWAAQEGVADNRGPIQDLAASIFEAQPTSVYNEVVSKFPKLPQSLKDLVTQGANVYAQYRAAFALFKHGARQEYVVDKLRDALGDEDVAEIAHQYLNQLGG